MNTNKNKDWQTIILITASFISAFVGLGILMFFLIGLGKEFTVSGDSSIMLDKTGQVGDFIGGFVGSLWAFTGVLLFYLSLRLQRKEFALQREELINQRTEFRINRLTNVIFNQVSRIENQIKVSKYLTEEFSPVEGISGIYFVNEQLRETCSFIKTGKEEIDTQKDLNLIFKNTKTLYELLDILLNSTNVINQLIDSSKNLSTEEKNELKFIYTENLGDELKNMIQYVHKITNNYFFHRNNDYLLTDEDQARYFRLKNITGELIERIKK